MGFSYNYVSLDKKKSGQKRGLPKEEERKSILRKILATLCNFRRKQLT